jgi:hypothetical protein
MDPRRSWTVAEFQALIDSGRLRRGMTRAEVRSTLGEPDDVGCTSRKYRAPACFKYGEVQFFFGPRAQDGLERLFWEDAEGQEGFILAWTEQAGELPGK